MDSSAWVEVMDPRGRERDRFREALLSTAAQVVTSTYVVDETLTACLYAIGFRTAVEAGELFFEGDFVDVVRLTAEDEREAWQAFRSQPGPKRRSGMSFTDCSSIALMRRLGITRVLTKDRGDFAGKGFEVLP